MRGLPLAGAGLVLAAAVLLASCSTEPAAPVGAPSAGAAPPAGVAPSEAPRTEEPPAPEPLVIGIVPEFELVDQLSRKVTAADLRGRVWVASFIYARCTDTCPMQTARLAGLAKEIRKHPLRDDVRYVSFTVDPDHDTPEVLAKYADGYGADPDVWRFLTGPREVIWALGREGFKLGVGRDEETPGKPLFHSTALMVVDRRLRLRGVHGGMTDDGVAEALAQVREILGEPREPLPIEPGPARSGGPTPEAVDLSTLGPELLDVPVELGGDYPAELVDRRRRQLETLPEFGVFTSFHFEDRLGASGISFRQRIVDDVGRALKPTHYDHGNGLVAADVDGDGMFDLYFPNQVGGGQLWRGAGAGRFEDVTATAGVGLADRIGVSAAFADIDNDGDPDLFATSVMGGNVLFENDGHGRFQDITAAAGLGAVAHSSSADFFDFDHDGLLDLLVSNVGRYTTDVTARVVDDGTTGPDHGAYSYRVGYEDAFSGHLFADRAESSVLYRNLGERRFEDVTKEVGLVNDAWSGDAAPIDANGDGWTDLYVLDMQGHDRYYENVAGKRFEDRGAALFPRTPWGSMGVKAFDVDADGDMDLLVTDMHSDMSAECGPTREKEKSRMRWSESFLASGGRSIFGNAFFRKEGAGYRELSDALGAETYWPWGISVGDLNADGYDDVFVTAGMNYPFRYGVNTVLLNDRGTVLRDAEWILGVEPRRDLATDQPWFELDCDGRDGGNRRCAGRSGRVVVRGVKASRASLLLDVDGDGDLDVITNEMNASPMVLVSNLAQRRHIQWLAVKLQGSRSNRQGLGAVVTVESADGSGPRRQVKVMDGQSGYLSQSDMPLYFGLGDATRVASIGVVWPSGAVQEVRSGVDVDGLVTITEH